MVPGAAPPVWRDSPVMLGLVLVSAKDRETAFLVDLPLALGATIGVAPKV